MKSALLHVSLPFVLCVALANSGLFDAVEVDLDYGHYAEPRVDALPCFLAMPCNCLVNLLYILMGLYWLLRYRDDAGRETQQSRYARQVFAFMALFYAPVQWTRLAVLRRAPAVLDQWFTLPIFAWVPLWVRFIEEGPKAAKWHAAAFELLSLLSYGLSLAHAQGFELALGVHVVLAVYSGVRVQLARGDGRTRRYLLLASLSCAGFVVLKLLDHWLAQQHRMFQRFSGHFWSKVCDVLQFHYSFCFLSALGQRAGDKQQSTHYE